MPESSPGMTMLVHAACEARRPNLNSKASTSAAGFAALNRKPCTSLQPCLEKLPVRQIGQAIMVGHIGDPGLGLAPFGDVDDGDEVAVAAVEADAPSERQHLNFAAIGLEMPPVAPGVIVVADLLQRLGMGYPFIPRPDLLKLHAQKRGAAVSIM